MNDSIWSRVHAMLDCGHWVPEYEDGVREFELEDSKRSDLPGDFSNGRAIILHSSIISAA